MNKRTIVFLFILSFFVRLIACWAALRKPELAGGNDAVGYHALAAALWQGQFPSLFRTPGYPLVLALVGATSGERVTLALLLHMMLEAGTTVLISAIAWHWLKKQTIAVGAGLLYAFCPVAVANTGFIGTEPQAVFLVVAAFWFLCCQRSRLSVLLQSVCWFAATMTRPSYAMLPLVASFFIWLWDYSWLLAKRQAVMLLLYTTLTASWIGFNYVRAGMAALSSNPDVSFYIYDTAALRMAERISLRDYVRLALFNPPAFDREFELYQRVYATEEQMSVQTSAQDLWFTKDDPEAIRKLRAEAVQKVSGHYPLLMGIHLTGVFQSLRPQWNSAGWFFRVLDVLRILLLPLALGVLLWQRQWWWLTFFGVWAVYALLPPGPASMWRFRAPLEPFISITFAATLREVGQWFWQGLARLFLQFELQPSDAPPIKIVR